MYWSATTSRSLSSTTVTPATSPLGTVQSGQWEMGSNWGEGLLVSTPSSSSAIGDSLTWSVQTSYACWDLSSWLCSIPYIRKTSIARANCKLSKISNEDKFGLDKESFYLRTIVSNMRVSTVRVRIHVFLLFRAWLTWRVVSDVGFNSHISNFLLPFLSVFLGFWCLSGRGDSGT